MDKAQALHSFWSGFGLDAIDELSSYDEKTMEELNIHYPYISYEAAFSSVDDPLMLGADLWYQSVSWEEITKKAEEIEAYIGLGGRLIRYDGGGIWITRASVFSRRMAEETGNDNIRRVHLNINAEYLSA